MRHDYERINLEIILGLRGKRLDDLMVAVMALLKSHDPAGEPFFDRDGRSNFARLPRAGNISY